MTHYLGALTQFIKNFEPRANFQITLTDPREIRGQLFLSTRPPNHSHPDQFHAVRIKRML